ncbi:hypothetical protein OUZ56_031968 [Daphnia magna]|uniref:Uncharacterized protein n=1 Tax=Daphnia magna TaxID=35525 RepID=A0ABQ9ZVR6_9CRUS|nr:hypothetical protein OUZ56_031968 [Daphnia magna]
MAQVMSRQTQTDAGEVKVDRPKKIYGKYEFQLSQWELHSHGQCQPDCTVREDFDFGRRE